MTNLIEAIIDFIWGPVPIDAVQELFGPGWLRLFEAVTLLGDTGTVLLVASILFWTRGRGAAYAILSIVALVAFVNPILKAIVDLPRPADPSIVVWHDASQSSFPSGHSATAATLWGSLATLGYVPAVVAGALIGGVMLSRMYLGAHFLGDVIGGALFGILLAVSLRRIWPMLLRLSAGRPFAYFLALGVTLPVVAFMTSGLTSLGAELLGLILGVGIGMPIELRYVDFAPTGSSPRQTILKLAIGLAGLGGFIVIGSLLTAAHPVAIAAVFAGGALWVVVLAPTIFVRTALASREEPSLLIDGHGG